MKIDLKLLNKKFIFSGKRPKGGSFWAKGYLCDENKFMILKGSHVNIKNFNRTHCHKDFVKTLEVIQKKIDYLLSTGLLLKKDNFYIFQQDYLFNKPSAAAVFFCVRNCNGWTAWKEQKSKKSLKIFVN